jgi:group I intron endonuclease
MTKAWTIYRHKSPSGKIYIGITSRLAEKRWRHGTNYHNCILFQRAIDRYGWDNIKHEILFTNLEESRAKSLEIDLIRHYKNLGISYNVTNGGDGALGRTPTDSTRRLLSMKGKLRVYKPLSIETRRKMSEARYAKFSKDSIYQTTEFRNKMAQIVSIRASKVTQLSINGESIASYNSAMEAQLSTGIDRGSILRCCKGKVRKAGGYIWKYKED